MEESSLRACSPRITSIHPGTHALRLLVGLALLASTATGCDSSSRLGLRGTVKLDGEPLANGTISFTPQSGTAGPTAGSVITKGTYDVKSPKGLLPGSYRVEITGWRFTGRKITNRLGQEEDETESVVPARYNKQSELTADLAADGAGQFDFELSSN